jgi:hypothetical protein
MLLAFALAWIAVAPNVCHPAILYQHSGGTDPTTEGWSVLSITPNTTVGPFVDPNCNPPTAWAINNNAAVDTGIYSVTPTPAEVSAAANCWRLKVRVRVTQPSHSPGGSMMCLYRDGTTSYQMHFGSDANGNARVVLSDNFDINGTSGASFTVPGGSVCNTFELVRPCGSSTADLYVNGNPTPVLTGYAGFPFTGTLLAWGDGSTRDFVPMNWSAANYSDVTFSVCETNPVCCDTTVGSVYNNNFNAGPGGVSLFPNAVVSGGILKLTPNVNYRHGGAVLPAFFGTMPIHSFHARFKLFIGGGTTADGFSFNLMDTVPTAFPYDDYEEGVPGAGLTVEFNTFDTGADPVGIFLKDGSGSISGSGPNPSQGPTATVPTWRDVDITMDSCGRVEVRYDGQLRASGTVSYVPAPGARFVLAARTGGQNDYHWVDDLNISVTKGTVITVQAPASPPCCAVVNYPTPCFMDDCDTNLTIVCSPPSGTWFPVGINRVCCTATDDAGNVGSCGFTVIVKDVTPPMIDCSQVPAWSSNACVSFVPNYVPFVIASDNCSTNSQLVITQNPAAGSAVGPGTHTVTLTICDASGNCVTCISTFTVTAPLKPIPGVFSTGVDANNAPLPAAAADPHYGGVGFNPVVTLNPAAFGWKTNDACSQWISPTANGLVGAADPPYVYTLSFYLDSDCTNDVIIAGEWYSTGQPVSPATMTLNGGPVLSTSVSAITPAAFSLTGPFQAGLNTLTFTVPVDHSTNGLRVCIQEAFYRCCECGVPAPQNLVLWLPFDEPNTSGFAHNVAWANNGNYSVPAPTVEPNGYVDRSLRFNGMNRFVRVPFYSAIDVTSGNNNGSLTIDAWVRREPDPGAARRQIVDHRQTSPLGLRGYALYLNSGVLTFFMGDILGNTLTAAGPAVPADGQWHFVAVTLDRATSTIRLYVDGTSSGAISSSTVPGSLANGSSVTVGARNFGLPAEVFKGWIDEVEIFRRALTPNEIGAIRGAFSAGKCKVCCDLPNVGFCPGELSKTITARIYNKSADTQTFAFGLSGLLPGCGTLTPKPPLTITTVPTSPIVIPPWTCVPITVTVPRPPNLVSWSSGWGCIKLLAASVTSGEMVMCQSSVFAFGPLLPWNCFGTHLSPVLTNLVLTEVETAARGTFASGPIPVENPFETNIVLNYRVIGIETLDVELDPLPLISLNGLPPGTAITNSLALAPGETSTIEFSGQFLTDDPNRPHVIWIEGRLDESEPWAPLADLPVVERFQPRMDILSPSISEGRPFPAVSWSGLAILESAPTPIGPWTDVTNAPNPYVISPGGGGAKFWRSRVIPER